MMNRKGRVFMTGNPIRISRERKVLMARYAVAAVNLYGLLSVQEFVQVFNHYEAARTTPEEAVLAVTRLAKTDGIACWVYKDILSGPYFQPRYRAYSANVSGTREEQKGKPRYLPNKEEFLKYVDPLYFEPAKPYADLRAVFESHPPTFQRAPYSVEETLTLLREMIRFGDRVRDEIQFLDNAGYPFEALDDVNGFIQKLEDAMNNTRLYVHNGFTPTEMYKLLHARREKMETLSAIVTELNDC